MIYRRLSWPSVPMSQYFTNFSYFANFNVHKTHIILYYTIRNLQIIKSAIALGDLTGDYLNIISAFGWRLFNMISINRIGLEWITFEAGCKRHHENAIKLGDYCNTSYPSDILFKISPVRSRPSKNPIPWALWWGTFNVILTGEKRQSEDGARN